MNDTSARSFDEKLIQHAKLFKALAHPARLAILQYLSEAKTCITGDIADELPLSRTTVSQHLQELKNANLITGTVEGVKTNYCLNAKAIELFRKQADEFFAVLDIKESYC
jgi:ArsR family transcriptional regulator, arsenate/arsenite/antimonite-responsive transcriptional repressor